MDNVSTVNLPEFLKKASSCIIKYFIFEMKCIVKKNPSQITPQSPKLKKKKKKHVHIVTQEEKTIEVATS